MGWRGVGWGVECGAVRSRPVAVPERDSLCCVARRAVCVGASPSRVWLRVTARACESLCALVTVGATSLCGCPRL